MSETFSERLKRLRAARGLSQPQVGDAMGCTAWVVCAWETQRHVRLPRTHYIRRLADLYGVSIEYLLTGSEPDAALHAAIRRGEPHSVLLAMIDHV